eukprot:4002122-Amphidinium_carterae.1
MQTTKEVVSHCSLPRGIVHGAWAEDSEPPRLLVACRQVQGHGIFVYSIADGPTIDTCWLMPAVGSLADCRPNLRRAVATTQPGMLAMFEAGETTAFTVYRHVPGATRAPFMGFDADQWEAVPGVKDGKALSDTGCRDLLGIALRQESCLLLLCSCI